MRVKKILIYTILLNVLTVLLYHFFLKQAFLSYAENKELSYDRSYYFDVFSNIEFSGLIVGFVLLVLLLSFGKLKLLIAKISPKQTLLIGICLLVLIQASISLIIKTNPISDSATYIDYALRLKETGVFSDNTGNVTNFWPVGLPFLISAFIEIFGNYQIPMNVVNILISIGLLLIMFYLFKEELNKTELSFFVFVYVLFPANWFIVNVILTDYIFTFLTWLIILLVVKGNKNLSALLLVGSITGIAIYFRSIALFFPVLIFIYFLFSFGFSDALWKIIAILSLVIIIQLPWGIRNYQYFDEIIFTSTNGGFNFLMGNHEKSSGKINFSFEYDFNNPNEVEESKKAYRTGIEYIIDNPITAVSRILQKIFYSYYRGDVSLTWTLKSTANKINGTFLSFLFYISNISFYFITFFSVFGFWRSINQSCTRSFKFITVIFILYFHLVIIVFVGNERYLLPLYPLYFLYFVRSFGLKERKDYEVIK